MQNQQQLKARFVIQSAGDGFQVIDDATGRPMRGPFNTAQQASGSAHRLNTAAKQGRRALARALGAGEDA